MIPPAEGTRPSPGMLEISVTKAEEVDQAIRDAIGEVSEAATQYRMGILVTRIGAGRYIVRAHPAVPYGLIRQKHD
ncbi:hypothetical protein M1D88_01385 [Arthrobacter sp. R1-13]